MKPSGRLATVLAVTVLALCATPSAMAQSPGAPALAARSNTAGGVRVDIKPMGVVGGSALEFEVVIETHTTPLDADLTKIAVLVDDNGRRYVPLSWQGDPPGGHHRKGVLRFPPPSEQIKSLELQIEGLGGATKRVFQWTIK